MKKIIVLIFVVAFCCTKTYAQRFTDALDRGVVVVPVAKGNFISWRRLGEEYYDVTYNLYQGSTKVASDLKATHFFDETGNGDSQYTVCPVVGGVEKMQELTKGSLPWNSYYYSLSQTYSGYLDIKLGQVMDRNGNDVTSHYSANDAEVADLDGDGDLEIIIKRLNTVDATAVDLGYTEYGRNPKAPEGQQYDYWEAYDIYLASNTTEFVVIEAYDVNWNTGDAQKMWWIDCGPNMVSLNSTEINVIAYDWDMDGRAEVVLRGADDMRIHYVANGTEHTQVIGDPGKCYRHFKFLEGTDGAQYAWTHEGDEFLIYMDGLTGQPYQVMEYPLKRLESGETNLNAAWGDGYGHRSSKYFFGAPYLDGQRPSLFLARGIYTRHKMVAYDIDPSSHQLTLRWKWECNDSGSSWFGNGYHNYIVADVDEDGRDEIVYGSMVIDDTGKGLSTSGLGHGDAQHVSDFDPYRKGLEFFGCNEDKPGMNYRDATSSKMYVRMTAAKDDGRAIMANFSNTYPGAMGRSVSTNMFSSVSDKVIPALEGNGYIPWDDLNFRIYWDGDLLSEILDSPGTGREAKVEKPGVGRLFTSSGCNMNNDSKNNPCFQGDIIGDWREEIIVRCGDSIRVYTTAIDTEYDIYTLWHDHQYRQAMGWQMMAYNQPPHLSFFLGEMEGITVAPPPLTLTGRTVLADGASITTADNGEHLLMTGYANMNVSVGDGAQPAVITVNAPAWVKGNNDNNNITTTTYKHSINGAALTGDMRLTKQGWGQLILSDNTHTYTGPTEVWQGALTFNGQLTNSVLWLNRFSSLNSSEGSFKSIKADYGASLNIGGAMANVSSVFVDSLCLGFGARVVFDIHGDQVGDNDQLVANVLNLEKKTDETWVDFGPEYLAPRFCFNTSSTPTATVYPLGQIGKLAEGCSIGDIIIEGIDGSREPELTIEDGMLYLKMKPAQPTVAPELAVIDMVLTDMEELPAQLGPYYMPKVAMRAKGDNTTLSGYFTDADGNTTYLNEDMFVTLRYSQDYESSTDASGWTCNTGLSLANDEAHGNYINLAQNGGSGSRYAYTSFEANVDEVYCAEFDVAFHPTQGNYANNALILYGGNVPDVSKTWWEWSGNNDYVFRINGGANKGTSYTVEGDNNSFTMADNAWYHFKVVVNQATGEVAYTVYSGSDAVASGSYSVTDSNIHLAVHGMFINLGRNNSNAMVDNIRIANDGEPAFTFTTTGTLCLTASENGYSDNTISMTVEQPYVIRYDSPDFSTIAAADAAAVLGSDLWQEAVTTGRWSYWVNGTYSFATAFRQDRMYVDSERVLWANVKSGHPGNRLLQLVEGYGLGQNHGLASDADANEGTVFHAEGLGDGRTIIYHQYDLSRGAAAKTVLSEYMLADENGNYDYDSGGNFTLQKFTAYIPYEGFLLGDANGDQKVTVADIMLTVNYILKGHQDRFVFRNADINFDKNITVADVMGIVNLLLH